MGYLRQHMIEEMELRSFSPKTKAHYLSGVSRVAKHFQKSPLQLRPGELRDFFLGLHRAGKSASVLHCFYNSLAFFYTLHRRRYLLALVPRPRVVSKTPVILAKEEVVSFLNCCASLKYRALFALVYSAGLRVSEVLALRVGDIDYPRHMVHINLSKNLRERFSILGERAAELTRAYQEAYAPTDYLFYCKTGKHRPLRARTVQHAFAATFRRTGIAKRAHVHTLRHCFATHMVEDNVNLFIIMKLLGHRSLETTQNYLSWQRYDLQQVESPIDRLPGELCMTPEQMEFAQV